MTDLTNLEICKRIAEIEGLKSAQVGNVECAENHYVFKDSGYGDGISSRPYNPLTDDALCFKFCYEHEILVRKSMSVIDNQMVWNGKYYAKHPRQQGFGSVAETPNKAVCLEYIEFHKE